MTLVQFCSKVEWEGGVIEALNYGLKTTDLDGDDSREASELRDIWTALQSAWEVVGRLENEAEQIIGSVLDEDSDGGM